MDFKEKLHERMMVNPYDRYMNYRICEAEHGRIVMETVAERRIFENSKQSVHGGFLFGMADVYMGAACLTIGSSVTTMNLNLSYFRPTEPDSTVRGEARVIHAGRRTIAAECDFYDAEGKLLAHGIGTYFVVGTAELTEDDDD